MKDGPNVDDNENTTASSAHACDMEANRGSAVALQPPAALDLSAPLRGVVLCCTSIPPDSRTALAKQAEQMGAQHKYDLTSEVTHLIVGEYDTPKYRYVAKERPDVKILTPDWIEALRQLWMADRVIDLEALEAEHTLPTLATLQVCMTGFEDPERSDIIDLVRSNGAAYHGNLTKSLTTHLIARRPEGAKYKFAKDWKVRLVSVEWLYDTIQRGMILDEKLYHPEMLPDERGKGAWVRRKAPTSLPDKRLRENEAPEDGSRKIRRTLSSKFTSQNEVIWGDIVGGSGALSKKVEKQEQTAPDLLIEEPASQKTLPDRSNSGHGTSQPIVPNVTKRSTFSQCRFYIHGFEKRKRQTLCRHLLSHDADVCDSSDDLGPSSPVQRYMVVPHDFAVAELPAVSEGISVVTDWWVERCLEAKECLEQSSRTFDLPLPHRSVEQFEKLTVSTTGFTGFQLLHLSKVVTLMGATYDEFFSEKSSVLICNAVQQIRIEKLQRAKEWKIPVVSIDWLLDSIASGSKQLYKPYILRSMVERTASAEERAPSQVATKKGVEYDGFDAPEDQPLPTTAPLKVDRPPARPAPRDSTAFDADDDDDEPTELIGGFLVPKEAPAAAATPPAPPADPATEEPSPEPLVETSPNSPSKPTAAASAATEISDAITSLLAKTKHAPYSGNSAGDGSDSGAARAPRKPSRILGRAPSNASRASSVDSTVSGGQAVQWPAARRTAVGSLGGGLAEGEEEQAPPMTQRLQYEDEQGEMYKARVIARMAGRKPERRERARVATVGGLDGKRSLRAREKGAGGR